MIRPRFRVRTRSRPTAEISPPVRSRTRHPLPPFDPRFTPQANTARHDKIEISFAQGWLSFRSEELHDAIERVANGAVFARGRPDGRHYNLKFRAGWLVEGQIRIDRPRYDTATRTHVFGSLNLNPTRFMAHRNCSLAEIEHMSAARALRQGSAGGLATAVALDGKDNVLVGEQLLRDTIGVNWRRVLDIYIGHIQDLIVREFRSPSPQETRRRSSAPTGLTLDLHGAQAAVRQAEVYWERSVPDALAVVSSMEHIFRAIGTGTQIRRYSDSGSNDERLYVSPERERNALSLRIGLGVRNVNLTVYAKTEDRIRFEVRYLDNVRTRFASEMPARAVPRGLRGIVGVLERASQDAARRLEPVFARLRERSASARPHSYHLARLLALIADATEGHRLAIYWILSMAAHNDGISAPTRLIPAPVIKRLIVSGVIERSRIGRRERVRRYVLTRSYRTTLETAMRAVQGMGPRGEDL